MQKNFPMFDESAEESALAPQVRTLEHFYTQAELPAQLTWADLQSRQTQAQMNLHPFQRLLWRWKRPAASLSGHTTADTNPSASVTNGWRPTLPAPGKDLDHTTGGLPRFLSGLASLAVVLVIVLLAVALFANRPRPLTPGSGNTPQALPPGPFSWLYDIAMVSPTEGWAVGATSVCTGTASSQSCTSGVPLMMHYHNHQWSRVALPFTSTDGHNATLNSIQMLSATDGWASGPGHLLHYDGQSWKLASSPEQLNLEFFQMFSDTDGWAIGQGSQHQAADIMHYDGKTWTAQPLPAGLGLGPSILAAGSDLSMISPTEGWAVYTILQAPPTSTDTHWPGKSFILHYTDGAWTVQASIKGDTDLGAISMTSAADGWAVGQITPPASPNTPRALLLHYTRGNWVQVDSNATDSGDWVSMTSATDGWMVGGQNNQTLLHYNGVQWLPIAFSPAVQSALGRTYVISRLHMTSATEGWAVGAVDKHSATEPTPADGIQSFDEHTHLLILYYHNGAWSIASQ
jgi:hypothetical protein